MSLLTICLKKAGDAIHADDKAAILDRSRELRTQGKSPTEAAQQAVDEQIAKVQAMLGTAPKAAPPAAKADKIDDVGEKIGGARKDTAESTGARARRTDDDDRPAWARRFKVSQIVKPDGQINAPRDEGRWVIHDSRSLDWMGQPKQVGRQTFATKEEADAFVPLAAVGLKHRVVLASSKKGEPDHYEIWRDITDRKRVKVVDKTFDTRDEALTYMAAHAAEIIEANTTFGEADLPLPPDRKRVGPERRADNVTGQDFKDAFGFRGVEFGNWNNQDERQALMNDAYDGLMDLADVMGVPARALGLNGDLALAFGARGHGLNSARAHYERDRAVINLTKERGAGSLAHEWFHALDHYFGRQDGKASAEWVQHKDGTRTLKAADRDEDYVSHGFRGDRSGVRPELRAAYDKVMQTIAKKAEVYVEDTAKADSFTARARDDLAQQLDSLRAELSAQKDPTYWKRNNKPASAEQLAEFDTIAKAMLEGQATAIATEWRMIQGGKAAIAARWTNDSLERLSAIYKAVRGRSGFDSSNREGRFDKLRGYMERYSQRLKMLADAQTGAEKQRMVPTEFAMNAKELDQGRGGDYWTTPHEMAARAFQGYVEDKIAERGGVSRFLNYGPENVGILTPWGVKRPFPAGEERKAINAAFDKFVEAVETKAGDDGGVVMFSRGQESEEAAALRTLSQNDDLFALRRSDAILVRDIAADIDPDITVRRVAPGPGLSERWAITLPGANGDAFVSIRKPNPYGPTNYGFDLDDGDMSNVHLERPGSNRDAVGQSTEDVWIDVSKLKEGEGGHKVYAIAGALARNTGRMFIGDPNGFTDVAMRRRSEAMLSLALRYGTSKFLAPHPRQLNGSKAIGIPPLAWDYADDLGNIRRLIALNTKAVENASSDPSPIFDATTGRFTQGADARTDHGHGVHGPAGQGLSAAGDTGRARADGAGHATAPRGGRTAARAAVWRALLREEGGGGEGGRGRDGVLARLAKLAGQDSADGQLSGLFSRGANDSTGLTVTGVQAAVDELTKDWKNAPTIVVAQDMRDPLIPLAARRHDEHQRSLGATGDVRGFIHGGRVYLIADELPTHAAVAEVVFHEALGHYGLRGVFDQTLGDVLDQMATAMPERVLKKAREYGLVDKDGKYHSERARLRAAEEVLAEIASERPSSTWVQRAIAAIKQWLRDNIPSLAGLKLTDADVIALFIEPARRFVEQGASVRAARGVTVPAFSRGPQKPLDGVPAAPEPPAPPRQPPLVDGEKANPQGVWTMPEDTKLDNAIYKFQDKNVDLKRATEAIRAENRAIGDRFDAYLQEELYHGRAASRVEDFAENELRPLMTEMKLRAVTQERLSQYLHARHAEEANELIAERGGLADGGSGMTTADARAFLASLDPAERKRLDAVATKVDAMIAKTREAIVDYGLEARDTVDGWAAMFKHYVPLQREEHDGEGMGIGQGFSIRGKEAKHRTGSTAAVSDILANVAMQRERAIVRGEKNRVAVAMVGLALTNPNPDVWKVEQAPTEQVLNETTGQIERRTVPGYKSLPNVLVAKIKDGKGNVAERVVVFNERNERAMRMATALKNLDAEKLEGLIAASAKVTRYFASINTQYNPVFGFTNLARDLQAAAINLSGTPIAGRRAEVMANAMKFLGEAARAGFRMDGIKDQALWKELQSEGGTTGYRDLYRTTEDRANAIKRELDPHYWHKEKLGQVLTAGGALAGPAKVAQATTEGLFNWLSDFNESLENVTRLAAYKVALDHGLSRQRAASLAKNLTVNFNRGGAQKPLMGAMYAFFNAAMQGTARIAQTVFEMKGGDIKTLHLTKAGKAIIGGGITLGVLQALALAAAGFEDDDIPEFIKERNLILPLFGTNKKYITIPMPLGYHVLPNMGRRAAELAIDGGKGASKKAAEMFGTMLDAFNPLGGGGTVAQILSPTALDPMVALLENKDWTGQPIAKKDWSPVEPGFKNAREASSDVGKWIAQGINRVSGGTEFVRGKVSPTPDQIDYLIGQATGGVGRELSKLATMASAARTGETLPTHKIPLVGRFYGDASQAHNQSSRFYESLTRMREHNATIDGLAKQGRGDEMQAYLKANPEAKMADVAERAGKKLSELRAARRLLIEKGQRERVKQLEQQITEYMTTFNKRVDEAQAPSSGATKDQTRAPARATQEPATMN